MNRLIEKLEANFRRTIFIPTSKRLRATCVYLSFEILKLTPRLRILLKSFLKDALYHRKISYIAFGKHSNLSLCKYLFIDVLSLKRVKTRGREEGTKHVR